MSIFYFTDITKSEETIQKTWDEFRSKLALGVFSYNELGAAKENSTFLRVFDDLFENCHDYFDFNIEDILSPSTTVIRAAKLHKEDPEPTYERFIPKKEYITSHNRFSPPGLEWLYLAIGDEITSQTCALKECRANKGDYFGLCRFELNQEYKGKPIVDLTIADSISYAEINDKLEKSANKIRTRETEKALKTIKKYGFFKKPNTLDFQEEIEKWVAFTYTKLLSNQIFVPVETENKELMYTPFQCMAQYFLSRGYEGIVYSSTVYQKGKNVVLFDKNATIPKGKIKKLCI